MPTPVLLAIALGAAAWYLIALRQPDADGFAPGRGYPALYLFWFGLGAMNLVDPDPDAFLWDFITADLWWYVGGGLLAYLAGLRVVPSAPATWHPSAAVRGEVARWNQRHVTIVLVALLGLILGAWLQLARQGALALLSADPGAARVEWEGPRIVWSVYHSALLAYVPLSLLYVWCRPAVGTTMRRVVPLSVLALLVMTLMFGNRSGMVEPALLAFLTWHYVKRPVTRRAQVALGASGLAFLSLAGIYRDVLQWGPGALARMLTWGFPLWSLPFTYMYTYMRDGVLTFQRLRTIVPDFSDYSLGAIHLAPLAAVLPGHQESADMVFKRLLNSEFVGFGQPATVLGPLYVDGGMPAIILGMFLFGAISGMVYTRLHRRPSVFRVLLQVWVVHVAIFSLFAGLLPALTTVFVPLFTWGVVLTLRIGAAPAAPSAPPPRPLALGA